MVEFIETFDNFFTSDCHFCLFGIWELNLQFFLL